jgi:hypothetical protein
VRAPGARQLYWVWGSTLPPFLGLPGKLFVSGIG